MSTLNTVKNLFLSSMFVLNIAFTQDVSIGVGDVTFPGYTDDLVVPITVTNPNNSVGGIQFDVNVAPSMVMLSGVSTYGTAESGFNWIALREDISASFDFPRSLDMFPRFK